MKAIYKVKSKANKAEVWISEQQFWLKTLYVDTFCTNIIILLIWFVIPFKIFNLIIKFDLLNTLLLPNMQQALFFVLIIFYEYRKQTLLPRGTCILEMGRT